MRIYLITAALSLMACTMKAEPIHQQPAVIESVEITPVAGGIVINEATSYELKQMVQDGSESLAFELSAPYELRYTCEATPLPVFLSQEVPAPMPLKFPLPANTRLVSQMPNHRAASAFLARHNC